jgi:serpin B
MKVKVLRSEHKEEYLDAPAAEEDVSSLVSGNNAFALNLYRKVRKQDANLIFSPYSISLALAMTYAGARGETENEMSAVMNFSLEQPFLHPAFKSLDTRIKTNTRGEKFGETNGFRLRIVNSIWGQKGYEFLPEYLETLGKNYGSGLNLLDFRVKAKNPAALSTTGYWSRLRKNR